MTKLGLTADLHGKLPDIDECDILVIAGDIVPDFFRDPARDQKQRHWLDTKFRDWLDVVPAREVVAIAGNHDFVFEKRFLIPDLRWHYLENSGCLIDGLRFFGTPHVPNLPSWAFYGDDETLKGIAERIPSNTDVLLAHGPPFGIGDRVEMGKKVGNKHLTNHLPRIKPEIVVTGHIHEAYGHYRTAETEVFNVSHNTVRYEPINPIVYIEV